jgi:phage FluMu protein Com
MAIEFHCNHCAKLIRAPDEAGGRRGKCPYCKNSVYIPMPTDQLKEIPLAPEEVGADPADLDEDSLASDRAILRDDSPVPETDVGGAERSAGASDDVVPGLGAAEDSADELVVEYLALMRESELEQAETVVAALLKQKEAARQVVERLAADAVPPAELGDIPPPLYQGFLRNLHAQLK